LIHEPKLLLLDEPTAGVDVEIRRSMWEFLRYINANGTTIILTTHYLEEAENLCKRVAIIDGGSIIENTRMNTILKKLKREVFILTLQDSIEDSPFVEGYDISFVERDQLEVVVDSKQELNQLFVALKDQNIRVTSIRNRSNRLEELFMELVDSKQKESVEREL
jgi:ABC-2 type transport system ATP-binding protein